MSQPTIGHAGTGPRDARHPYRPRDPPPPPAGVRPAPKPYRPEPAAEAERTWAVAGHLSPFLAAYLALGLLGPLAVMLRGRSALARSYAGTRWRR